MGTVLAAIVGGALGYGAFFLAPRWTEKEAPRWQAYALVAVVAVLGGLLARALGADTLPVLRMLGYLRLWGGLALVATLVLASFVDLHKRIIPNELMTWTITWIGVLTVVQEIARRLLMANPHAPVDWLTHLTPAETLGQALLGILVGGGFLGVLAILFGAGMGMGDAKLAAVFGLYFGFQQTLLALLLGFCLGGAGGVVLLVVGKVKLGRKDLIAFGPYLAGGALVALLFGSSLLQWYLGSSGVQ